MVETNVLKEKCRNYCEEKVQLEYKLYSKFIPLLNGKKRRIENLEAKLRKGDAAKPEMDLHGTEILSSDSDVDDPDLLIDKKSSIFKTNIDSAKHKRSRNKKSSKVILKKPQSKLKEINFPTKLSSKTLCLQLDTKIKENEHYSSDTDVDENDTDENDESLFAFVSTEPKQRTDTDLFSELNSPDAVLPKRIKQDTKPGPSGTVPYRPELDTKPGPSGAVPYRPELTTQVHTFSTQDLFDDI
uniref:Uncharacterized protein n=1 Tax=Timema douglasi TaxID=61478 RepID=A0A7R8ZHE6_TIMDO|nr:unnamed protein product [Timema douglasi]